MKWFRFWILFPIWLQAAINSNGDYQFWQRSLFRYAIEKEWAFLVTTEARIGDDVSKFYYFYLQPQLSYAPTDWIAIAPGYRQVARRHPTNSVHWIPEYIPMCDVTLGGNAGEWRFEDRSRLEYVITEASPYPWLYRNRFRIFFPVRWTSIDMTPFVDDEIFWRQANGINEDRLSVGLRQNYTPSVMTETTYIARFLKGADGWTYQNVFLLWLSVRW